MRPLKPADAIRAIQITTRFPAVHGAPVHIGRPDLIGIKRHRQARLRRCGAGARRRDAGVLGLRGDAAVGGGDGEAGLLHHALARLHAGDRPQELRIRDHVRMARAPLSAASPVRSLKRVYARLRRVTVASPYPSPASTSGVRVHAPCACPGMTAASW